MKSVYIEVPRKKWGIAIVYDFDVDVEYEELREQMLSFGMSMSNARRALNVLSNYNTGMAVSNETLRMSGVYISKATSDSEWYSTAIHEFVHVADAILDYYGETWDGEPSAYLVGYLTKELVELVGAPCVNY